MNSAMKSAIAYPLVALLGIYLMSNSLSAIVHCTIFPELSGLFNTFISGALVRTLTVWAKKYGLNFLADTTNTNANLDLGSEIQLRHMRG